MGSEDLERVEEHRINVSAKIIADISTGIYRTPANALKELVSNAFDADATKVIINTDYPKFDTITCSDNGDGMTPEKFTQIMERIGGSAKRAKTDTTNKGRPIIGNIGIGILAVAQICKNFTVISSTPNSPTKFEALIDLEPFQQQDAYKYGLDKVDIGKFKLYRDLPEEKDAQYTRIILENIHPGFKRRLRELESPDREVQTFKIKKKDPASFEEFTKWLANASVRQLPEYQRMIWELAVICPTKYLKKGPVIGSSVINDIKKRLKDYDFSVIVDGIELYKPILFPLDLKIKKNKEYGVYDISFDQTIDNKRLKIRGYIYQQTEVITPQELRGILVRIRNVAIGMYDRSVFNFPTGISQILQAMSGEVYVDEGLEEALNIDRNSFKEIHLHYITLQELLFKRIARSEGEISSIAAEAQKRSQLRSEKKRRIQEKNELKTLSNTISDAYGHKLSIRLSHKTGDKPVIVDIKKRNVIIHTENPIFPRKRSQRIAYEKLLTLYEIATMNLKGKKELDRKFYDLLAHAGK